MTDPADHTEAMAGAQITQHLRRVDAVVLGGRYQLTERIASGGMASVWRAHDDVLARTVAVKLLHDHLAADEAFRERFRREAIAAAKLTHPNVVSLYDTGTDGDRVYLVMEFVAGATLREVIRDLGTLQPGQAAAIGERIARALDYAHERGLVHRDVKPANILIGDDGAVKVADFGIAKAEGHDGDLTKTGMVLGTAAYVAPEQITGVGSIDGRADQYALGCMLYESLAGRQPFRGDSAVATAAQRLESSPPPLRSLRADIPRGLDSIVMRAMAREPDDRFLSAGAMAEALAAYADENDAHTAALPQSTSHRAAPPRQETVTPSAGVAAPAARHSDRPFQRSAGRWVLVAVILLILAGGAVAGSVATGLLQLPQSGAGGEAAGRGQDAGGASTQRTQPLAVQDVDSFDPQGDQAESDSMLSNLLDDDGDTTWRTEFYNSADFGGFPKDGVGVHLDLGEAQPVTAVEVDVVSDGSNLQLRVADEPTDDPDGWQRVARADEASGQTRLELDEPLSTQHLLVFVTPPLPNHDGRYQAEIARIRVLGTARDDDS